MLHCLSGKNSWGGRISRFFLLTGMCCFVKHSTSTGYRFSIPVIHWYRIADFNRFDSLSVGFSAEFDIGVVLHVAPCWLLNGLQLNGWLVVQQPLFRWFNVQQPLYHTVMGWSERVGDG